MQLLWKCLLQRVLCPLKSPGDLDGRLCRKVRSRVDFWILHLRHGVALVFVSLWTSGCSNYIYMSVGASLDWLLSPVDTPLGSEGSHGEQEAGCQRVVGISCPRPSTTGTHGALLPPRSGLGTTVWAVDRAGNRQSRSSACKITYTVSLRCWFQLRFKASEFSLTLRPFSILKGCSDDDSSRSSHVLMPRCTHSSLHVTSQVWGFEHNLGCFYNSFCQ